LQAVCAAAVFIPALLAHGGFAFAHFAVFAQQPLHGAVARPRVVLRILREAIHQVREVGGHLGECFLARLRGARAEAEEPRLGGLVAGAQRGIQRLVAGRVVPPQRIQKAPHRDGEQLQTAQLRHRAEHVRGVQPLPADVQFEFPDQRRGDRGEDVLHVRVLAQQPPVVVQRARAQILAVARQPQGELHAGIVAPSLGRRVDGQVLELGDEQQARERVEFLGGPAQGCIKVRAEGLRGPGQQPQDDAHRRVPASPRARRPARWD